MIYKNVIYKKSAHLTLKQYLKNNTAVYYICALLSYDRVQIWVQWSLQWDKPRASKPKVGSMKIYNNAEKH